MGSGVPQYLSLEMPQSMTFSRKLPILPVPMVGGIQFTDALDASSSFLTSVTLMNQLLLA